MWRERDLTLVLGDPMPVSPTVCSGFGREGDILWSRIVYTNMGRGVKGVVSEELVRVWQPS